MSGGACLDLVKKYYAIDIGRLFYNCVLTMWFNLVWNFESDLSVAPRRTDRSFANNDLKAVRTIDKLPKFSLLRNLG